MHQLAQTNARLEPVSAGNSWLRKVPPHNVEAEQSILSAILIENKILAEVLEILADQDFYRTAHQKIFAAMLDLFEQNEPADLITLANVLKQKGELESVGGASYLAELMDQFPMAVNAGHYARIVREKAILRCLIARAASIAGRCFEDCGHVEDILDFAERAVFEISENRVKPSFCTLGNLLTHACEAVEKAYANKVLVTGLPTGYHALDEKTSGLQPGDFIVIAGRPGMGKTALALNIARNASLQTKSPTAVFSLEMSREQLSFRMLSAEARIDSTRMRGGFLSRTDLSRVKQAAGALHDIPIHIDDSPVISALEVRAKARRMKMEKKRPVLSDLRESGAIEQDADVIVFIYRDDLYNRHEHNHNEGIAELILAKQRNGPTGTVKLAFLEKYTRFENLAREDAAI
jgi:replicative DNA helicase